MSPLAATLVCLRFFSRISVPTTRREIELGRFSLVAAAGMVPLAGAIIGLLPSVMLLAATAIGLPAPLAAPFAIASLVVVTGAMHEDGLADCADGFGGGRDRAHKLEIMRDSRIGTFGACAVALSLYLRAAAVGIIAGDTPALACAAFVAAASLSRTASLVPLVLLPPARDDGLGAASARPPAPTIVAAAGLAIVITILALPLGASIGSIATAVLLALIGALAVCSLAWRQIGGQTGDVAGATQQVAEIAVLLAFAAV